MDPYIAHLHEDLRAALSTRRSAMVDTAFPMQESKTYPRMERFQLGEPRALQCDLSHALADRRSSFESPDASPLSLSDISSLFGHALRVRPGGGRRNYPSGGSLYPIETYLIATEFEGFSPGIFHLDPEAHALERLWDVPTGMEMRSFVGGYAAYAPMLIVFTAIWERSASKYGNYAFELSLIEVGHMSSNVLLVATALRLLSRPYSEFNDKALIEALDLDTAQEQPVHAISLSKPTVMAKNLYGEQ